jgi:hypothetical protein
MVTKKRRKGPLEKDPDFGIGIAKWAHFWPTGQIKKDIRSWISQFDSVGKRGPFLDSFGVFCLEVFRLHFCQPAFLTLPSQASKTWGWHP